MANRSLRCTSPWRPDRGEQVSSVHKSLVSRSQRTGIFRAQVFGVPIAANRSVVLLTGGDGVEQSELANDAAQPLAPMLYHGGLHATDEQVATHRSWRTGL